MSTIKLQLPRSGLLEPSGGGYFLPLSRQDNPHLNVKRRKIKKKIEKILEFCFNYQRK